MSGTKRCQPSLGKMLTHWKLVYFFMNLWWVLFPLSFHSALEACVCFSLLVIYILLLFSLASRSLSCSCPLVAKYMSKSCSCAVGLPGDQVLPLEAWLQWEACPEKRIWDCLCLALSLIRLKIVRVHWLLEVALIINELLYSAADSKEDVFVCGGVKEGTALIQYFP